MSTARKWSEKKTVTEFVKMGHVFQRRPSPLNASVNLDSLVSSSHVASCWYKMDRLAFNMVRQYEHRLWMPLSSFDPWQENHTEPSCFAPAAEKVFLHPSSICTSVSFPSKGQLSLEKVKAKNYKSHISFKDQHFLVGFKADPTWFYICHHDIPSGRFKSNSSCYDQRH